MPRRSRKRRRNAPARRRKRRRISRKRRGVTRLLRGPINPKTVAKLTFCDQITISPVNGIGSYIYRANSLYDPDFTSTGHQPMGFDQLMEQYSHYTVIGSKILLTVTGWTGEHTGAVHLSSKSTDTPSTRTEMMERPRTRYFIADGSSTGNHTRYTLKYKFSAKKFFGTKALVGEDSYKGSASSSTGNPTEVAYFHINAAGFNASDPGTLNINVRISYIAVFTEPKSYGQS